MSAANQIDPRQTVTEDPAEVDRVDLVLFDLCRFLMKANATKLQAGTPPQEGDER
jgi:hypothetical protein